MEKFIKVFLLIVILLTTVFFVIADYDTIRRGYKLETEEWLIMVSTIITSILALPALRFWYKLILFNTKFIFNDIDLSDIEFLKSYRGLAFLSYLHSLFLLISMAIFLSGIIFNPAANIFSYFIVFLFLLLFIVIAGLNKIAFNKIKLL